MTVPQELTNVAHWANRSANATESQATGITHMLCGFYQLREMSAVLRVLQEVTGIEPHNLHWPEIIQRVATRTRASLQAGVELDVQRSWDPDLAKVMLAVQESNTSSPLRLLFRKLLGTGSPVVVEFIHLNSIDQESIQVPQSPMVRRIAEAHDWRSRLKSKLSEEVLGQDLAVEMLVNAFFDACLLGSESQPRGVFTFLGPQGTGKTLMAEAFAQALQELGPTPVGFRRFDMGMYTQWGDVTTLFGTASSAGQIQEFVTAHPRCVILFDEIEKAHEAVFPALLPILDRGAFQDKAKGALVEFQDAWIIFTSNLGREVFDQDGGYWQTPGRSAEAFDILASAKKREEMKDEDSVPVLSPEFVSRLSKGGAVVFSRLQGRHYLELLSQGLREHTKRVGRDLPQIKASREAQMAYLLSILPNLDARKASARGRQWAKELLRQAYEQLGEELQSIGPDGFSIQVNLSLQGQSFLAAKLGQCDQKALVVDDDRRTYDLLEPVLAAEGTALVRCTDASQAEAAIHAHQPTFALVDLNFRQGPGSSEISDSIEALERIHQEQPSLPVYAYSENPEFRSSFETVAKGVLRKGLAQHYLPCHRRKDGGAHSDVFLNSVRVLARQIRWERLLRNQERGSLQVHLRTRFALDPSRQVVVAEIDIPREDVVISAEDLGSQLTFSGIPQERFDDIIGLDRAKSLLQDVLNWVRDPRPLNALGASIPRGYLLAGPPGCGKTSLARAFAGEAGLPFLAVAGGELTSKWHGETEAKIREVFDRAKSYAPSIIFIDELEGIAPDRGRLNDSSQFMVGIVNQLLAAMDGFKRGGAPVFVLGATNHPELLDPALRRPGRFDQIIPIDLPAHKDRLAFFQKRLAAVPGGGLINAEELARTTTGRSPAYLEQLVAEAKHLAAREQRSEVSAQDFQIARHHTLYGAKAEVELSEMDLELIAHHESGHAIARLVLFPDRKIDLITITPRENGTLGFVAIEPQESQAFMSLQDVEFELIALLAGRESERMLRGDQGVTTGASDDLRRATILARNAVMTWALAPSTGPWVFDADGPGSDMAWPQIQALLKKAQAGAQSLLHKHGEALRAMATHLIAHQDMTREQLVEIQALLATDLTTDLAPSTKG